MGLDDVARQSNEKVTSNIHYTQYNCNQVFGVDWKEKKCLSQLDKSFLEGGNILPKSLKQAVAGDV